MMQLDYASGESIYIQIKENFKKLIISGSMKEDDAIPSVRALASTLAINVNTVQRAYRELEAEGYIYSIPGKGNFVSRFSFEQRMKEKLNIEKKLEEIIKEAQYLNIEESEFNEMVKKIYENKK